MPRLNSLEFLTYFGIDFEDIIWDHFEDKKLAECQIQISLLIRYFDGLYEYILVFASNDEAVISLAAEKAKTSIR